MAVEQNQKRWYKGNLHMHTTESDGALPPDEALALYRSAGYDFVALTDHWKYSEGFVSEDGRFLCLPGIEYHIGENVRDGIYHIVALCCDEEPQITPEEAAGNPQLIVDRIRACGGLPVLAHPAWSMNRADQLLNIQGFAMTEIFNTVSGLPWSSRAYSGDLIDQLAASGCLLNCTAVDDVHYYTGDECRSYIMVCAEELSPRALKRAIAAGDFYATQGPEIRLTVQDGIARVASSPVSCVVFNSDAVWTPDRVTLGEGITEAEATIKPHESFIRAEVIDAEGKRAWSSPVPVN